MNLRLVAVAGLAIVFAEPAFAQQSPPCDGPQDVCQQIINLAKQYDAAANNNDAAAFPKFYTADALIVQPGPMVSGQEAIAKHYDANMKAGHWSNHVITFNEVHVKGNMAWAAGSWKTDGPGPNNTTVPYQGNWGAVYGDEGGSLKLRMLTYNMIQSPPEQTTAGAPPNR
jgi:ketosteroid isomerase-like protein